jgi:hypothetical protein
MTDQPDNDLVPVSVRLGEVVPPEDPEDWTKPLTWIAAAGMLLGPLTALAWFIVARPESDALTLGTWLLACAVAVGAVLTAATQQGSLRAWTATVAAALFSALGVIILGAAFAGERQVGAASPTLAHGFAAAVAGLAGAACASPVAALATRAGRAVRLVLPGTLAGGVAALVLGVLNGLA